MTLATIANRKMRVLTVASPATFTDIPEALTISGFGEDIELVETTNFDSAGRKEYIGGLADGKEFSVECNHIDGNTVQELLKNSSAQTILMQYARTDSSPETLANFSAVALGFEETPNTAEQNRITFNFKITGEIT